MGNGPGLSAVRVVLVRILLPSGAIRRRFNDPRQPAKIVIPVERFDRAAIIGLKSGLQPLAGRSIRVCCLDNRAIPIVVKLLGSVAVRVKDCLPAVPRLFPCMLVLIKLHGFGFDAPHRSAQSHSFSVCHLASRPRASTPCQARQGHTASPSSPDKQSSTPSEVGATLVAVESSISDF